MFFWRPAGDVWHAIGIGMAVFLEGFLVCWRQEMRMHVDLVRHFGCHDGSLMTMQLTSSHR